jgi:hypothetical protein
MYKGTGFVPVISSLKAHPRGPTEVPAAQQHYLHSQVLATEWYPERDFMALTECLARILEADGMADVWTYFGRVAAERDLKGTQQRIPVARRVKKAGIYRRFAEDELLGIGTWLGRMTQLWTVYHDTGRLVVGRSTGCEHDAVFRVYEYQFLTAHFIQLLTAYWSEYLTIVGLRATLRFARTTSTAWAYGEWELSCEQTADVAHALSAFPVLI